jgi:ParB family transcriptional regulator, chromosome partitioning protein
MKIETRAIDSLRPDSRNARKHGARNLATIRASLEQFGQRRAAVVRSDGTVLAGNGMLEAARSLGWSELSVTVVPDEWSEEQARAYALADNRTGELAEWDLTVLDEHLFDLSDAGVDIVALGFEDVNATPTDVDDAFSKVPDGERPDVTQMTFTMTLAQCDIVKAALALALDRGASSETGNANSNGNSLERICREWSDGR